MILFKYNNKRKNIEHLTSKDASGKRCPTSFWLGVAFE
jgi:hypothetical protein